MPTLHWRLFLDNSTAVCYINKGGGKRSRSLTAQQITSWCENRSITIQALHVPGLLNSVADSKSRAKLDSSDWKLDPNSFERILWELDIDLFASCCNSQFPRFIAWKPQPGAWAVNAFSVNWNEWKGYAFANLTAIAKL